MPKRDIKDIKKNKGIGAHPPFLAGDLLSWRAKFEDYKRKGTQADPEYTRLILVSIVSISESFYKELFARYIDCGEPYLNKAEHLHKKSKPQLSFDTLKELTKKSFTLGELYAYSLKYHSLKEITDNYETLVGEKYVNRIKNISFPLRPNDIPEVERAKSMAFEIFQKLDKVYVMRNALIHEYPANNVVVTVDQILEYLDAAWLLLMTTDRIFWYETKLDNPFR